MSKKEILFEYYRYQLIPRSLDINLFYTPEDRMLDLAQLKEKKNEIFINTLSGDDIRMVDSSNKDLVLKWFGKKDDVAIFKLGRRKKIIISNEDLEDEEHFDYPSVWVVINNSPHVQIIAISQDYDAFSSSSVVANILSKNFNIFCHKFLLEVKIKPILDKNEFWDILKKHENRITEIRFNLVKPNLANISATFQNELRELTDSTNSGETKVELNAPKGAVLENLTKDNERFTALADYSNQGGGDPIQIRVKGYRKMIKTNNTISKVSLDEAEITGPKDAAMSVFEQITNNK